MFYHVHSAGFDHSHPVYAMLSEGHDYGVFLVPMTYSLWGSHEAPIHEWVGIVRRCSRVLDAISRNHADIAIASFIEPASFDDCDGDVGILGQPRCDS